MFVNNYKILSGYFIEMMPTYSLFFVISLGKPDQVLTQFNEWINQIIKYLSV